MNTIRASFLPIAAKCPGALAAGEALRVETESADVARNGSAVHEVCRSIVASGERTQTAVQAAAREHRADADEIGRMSWRAFQWWEANSGAYPGAKTELLMQLEAGDYRLTGHADVVSLPSDAEVRLIDWKSGFLTDADAEPQMRAYGLLACRTYNVQRVTATVVWLRDETEQTWTWTADELETWWREIVRGWSHWDGQTFTTGEHCRYCPRLTACPAQRALMRATVSDLEALETGGQIEAEGVGKLYARVQVVQQMCERFRELARAVVAAHGPIPTPDGRELALVQQDREEIIPAEAWQTLLNIIGPDALAEACKVSKTAVLAAVAAKAPRGQKGKAKDALMDELRQGGCVRVNTIEQLRLRSRPTDEE